MSYLTPLAEPISRLFARRDVGSDASSISTGSPGPDSGAHKHDAGDEHTEHPRDTRANPRDPVPLLGSSSDDDDSEDDMEQIGRFSFRPFFPSKESIPGLPRLPDMPSLASSLPTLPTLPSILPSMPGLMTMPAEMYRRLIQRYLAPEGEPAGVVAAVEPANLPPIERVDVTADGRQRRRRRRDGRRGHRARHRAADREPYVSVTVNERGEPVLYNEPALRQRITEIRELGLPPRERDMRVQELMTENYYRIKSMQDMAAAVAATATATAPAPVHGPTDDETTEDDEPAGPTAASAILDDMIVTEEDRVPSIRDDGILGCSHYMRGCKKECSTCKKWYTCRICHDEVEGHKLIRQQTKHMLCMRCGTAQDAAEECAHCHARMARYYCDICKLWDDDASKAIYHCPDCGICRIGQGLGKDFFHCQRCNVCMSIELQNSHRCIEHSTECDCPICGDYLFTSTETVVFMRCGHSIHQSCFREHTRSSYKCPTCSRSVISMEAQFRLLDAEIQHEILPSPYDSWRSVIVCNDCQARSQVPFHFLGLKCTTCKSYNTVQLKLIKPEEENSGTRSHRRNLAALDAVSSDVASTSEYTDDISDSEFDILPRRQR